MRMTDFEYDGIKLSEMGYVTCDFSGGEEDQEIGNILTMNNIKAQDMDVNFAAAATYDDLFELEFQICKTPCGKDSDFVLEASDIKRIMRWLNRKKYLKFKPIYEDNSFEDVYYMATFNISLIKTAGKIIGLTLQMKTNAPYGFAETVSTTNATLSSASDHLIIQDTSDEIGHINCDAVITCKAAGELRVTNSLDPNNVLSVKNCKKDEVITLYGGTKIIESSLAHNKLFNDFNYNFIRVVNTYVENENVFTSTLPCEIKVSYNPIRKVGLVL